MEHGRAEVTTIKTSENMTNLRILLHCIINIYDRVGIGDSLKTSPGLSSSAPGNK